MSATTQATIGSFISELPESFDREQRLELLRKARKKARSRYFKHSNDYLCDSCGADSPLEVHHIDGNPMNNHLLNLAGVCHRCHKATHKSEKTLSHVQQWKADFLAGMGISPSEIRFMSSVGAEL